MSSNPQHSCIWHSGIETGFPYTRNLDSDVTVLLNRLFVSRFYLASYSTHLDEIWYCAGGGGV
jgi:hypothetical protein